VTEQPHIYITSKLTFKVRLGVFIGCFHDADSLCRQKLRRKSILWRHLVISSDHRLRDLIYWQRYTANMGRLSLGAST